jgi:hypothetical protein
VPMVTVTRPLITSRKMMIGFAPIGFLRAILLRAGFFLVALVDKRVVTG